MAGNSKIIPHFLKASSEKQLMNKILKLQALTGKEYYFITIYPVKGGVVAWYTEKDNRTLAQLTKDIARDGQ